MENLRLPCGDCLGCRQAHATTWGHRATHEASEWENNSFVTLTYDDDHLPDDGYLDGSHLTRFIKRLRKRSRSNRDRIHSDPRSTLRYFACGEYGDENQRPHYHLLLFNAGFADGHRVAKEQYASEILYELWPFGKHTFAPAEPGAAGNYIAKYQLKQQHWPTLGRGRYKSKYWDEEGWIDENGEWHPALRPGHNRAPPAPFLRMSLKPAIGHRWLAKYQDDLQHGYLINNGRKHKIPRAYKEKLADTPDRYHGPAWPEHLELAAHIIDKARTHRLTSTKEDNNNPARRQAAEQIHKRVKELTETRRL